MKKIIALTLFVTALSVLFGAGTATAATVVTDRSDYPPGSVAFITGSGFQSGETVELQVLRIDINENSGPEHNPWQVVADSNGEFVTMWFVAFDEDGATLQLTATGLASGLVAQTTFTDGPMTPTVGAQSGTLTYGAVQVATFNVTLTKTGGNNAIANLAVLGLPTGATYRFSPNNFSSTVSTSTVLTITNGATTPAGSYSLIVTNVGETTFGTGTLIIGKASTTGTMASSGNSALPGASVTFTNILGIIQPGAGTPTGTIQFRVNGVALGSPVLLNGLVAVSAPTSTLPHGSNTVTAEYVGDGNFFGVTNTLSPKQVINTPPVARAVTTSVPLRGVVTVNFDLGKYKLATDADGDTVTLNSAFGANNGDVGVAPNGLSLTYTNTGGGVGSVDTFKFTAKDGLGGFATNTVSVRLDSPAGFNQLKAGPNSLTYVGIPGAKYALENSSSMNPPAWSAVSTNTVGADGQLNFNLGNSPNGFYRTRFVSNQ